MRVLARVSSLILAVAVFGCSFTSVCALDEGEGAQNGMSSITADTSVGQIQSINQLAVNTALFGASENERVAYEYILRAVHQHHIDTDADAGAGVSAVIPQNLSDESLRKLSQAMYGNAGLYYWANQYSFSSRSDYSTVRFISEQEYSSPTTRRNLNGTIYAEINECLALTRGLNSDYDKIKAVHDWLCTNVTYAYDENDNPSDEPKHHNIVGVFTNEKSAVCDGYADAFQLLMNAVGIECATISGDIVGSDIGHSWNIVKLDGSWYTVDCTWDSNGTVPSYTNFLTGSEFESTSGRIVKTDYAFQSNLPTLSATNYSAPSITRQKYTLTYAESTGKTLKAYNNGVYVPSGTLVEEGTEIRFMPERNLSLVVNGFTSAQTSVVISGSTTVIGTIGRSVYASHNLPATGNLTVANSYNISERLPNKCIVTAADGVTAWGTVTWQPTVPYTPSTSSQEVDYTGTITCEDIEMPTTPVTVTRHIYINGEEYRLEVYGIPDGYNLRISDDSGRSYSTGSNVSNAAELTFTLDSGLTGALADFYAGTDKSNMTLLAASAASANYTVSGGPKVYVTAVPVNNNLVSIMFTGGAYDVQNGTNADVYSLGLPESTVIETELSAADDAGNITVPIEWDLSGYDKFDTSAHSIIVSGRITLPLGVGNANAISTSVSCTLNISAAKRIVSITDTIPTSVDVTANSAITATALGLPDRVRCIDENGSEVKAKIEWTRSGGGTAYTMTGALVCPGYVCDIPLSVSVNITNGFAAVPTVRLLMTDSLGDSVTAIEQKGAYNYLMKVVINPVVGHKNGVLTITVPDGLTLTGLASASTLSEIDSIESEVVNGKTVITVHFSDDIEQDSDVMFDFNLRTIYNVRRVTNSVVFSSQVDYSHDFGYLYAMGEEIPFTFDYSADEALIPHTAKLSPQSDRITARNDYNLCCDENGIFTIPEDSYSNAFTKGELKDGTADAPYEFYVDGDMPYFTSFKAIIPLPDDVSMSADNKFPSVFSSSQSGGVITFICNNAEKMCMYRDGYYSSNCPYMQDSLSVVDIYASDAEYGSVYAADSTIKYIFTDNFGNEYVIDTGKKYTVSAFRENSEYNVDLYANQLYCRCNPGVNDYSSFCAGITNLPDIGGTLSVRDVNNFKITINIPDGVFPSTLSYLPCDTATAYFANGATNEFDMSEGEASITFNDGNNRITKIELLIDTFGETENLCFLNMTMGGYLTYSDGRTIDYGTYYNDEIDTDCDFDTIGITVGNDEFTLDSSSTVFFRALNKTDNLECTAQSSTYNVLDASHASTFIGWNVENRGTDEFSATHSNVFTTLEVPETNGTLVYNSLTADFFSNNGSTNTPQSVRLIYANGTQTTISGLALDLLITSSGNTKKLNIPISRTDLRLVEIGTRTIAGYDTIKARLNYGYDIESFIAAYGKVNKVFSFTASVDSPEASHSNQALVSDAKAKVNTVVDAGVVLKVKSVSDVNMTVSTGVVQTDKKTVCAELYTTGDMTVSSTNYNMLNKLALSELKVTVKTRTGNADIVRDSFYLTDADGNTIYPTAVTAVSNGYSVTFGNVVTDWSIRSKNNNLGTFSKLYYDVKPMYYSASGTYAYENRVTADSVTVADEQTKVESNINPDGYANLVYRAVSSSSMQAGNVYLNSAASTSIDNYGTTDFDNSFDYGAYKCTSDSNFDYTLCVATPQDTEITHFTSYVVIPNKSHDTASIQNQSFKNHWNAKLKSITVNSSNAQYRLSYTTETPKADNSEVYTEYTNMPDDSVLSQITKIKIVADRVYNGDSIKFRLAYRDGFNAQDVYDSIYMSSAYSYTNAQLAVNVSGVTNAVHYWFEQLRVIYDANGGTGSVPTDNAVYSSGDEVTVKDGGTLSKDNFTFDGWSLNGVKVSSFVITDTTTLYAVWKAATTTPVDPGPNPPVVDPNPPVVDLTPSVVTPSPYVEPSKPTDTTPGEGTTGTTEEIVSPGNSEVSGTAASEKSAANPKTAGHTLPAAFVLAAAAFGVIIARRRK